MAADGNTGSNFNRYWYGNNNPYRFTDPDGREAGAAYGVMYRADSGESMTAPEAGEVGSVVEDALISVGVDLLLGGPSGEAMAIFGALRTARMIQKASKVERSVKVDKLGKFTRTTETRPGKGPGQSRAEYVRIKNADGKTVKTYKDSYDRAGKHQGRKPLRGGPEGRPQSDPPPPPKPRDEIR